MSRDSKGKNMSFADGWSAIHLEMPKRVPRTEYSVESHWELVNVVTGISITPHSSEEEKLTATAAFRKAWNYDFVWSTLIYNQIFGNLRTDMGHAEYAAGGIDRRDTIFCPFKGPEDVLSFDPWQAYGKKDQTELIRNFENHYASACRQNPDVVNMTGIYCTLVSGLIEIFGWELLLEACGMDPEGFGGLANRYSSWIMQYFEALTEANVPVVMVHDDMVWTSGAIFKPDWYRRYIFPNYKKYIQPLRDSGKRIMFTSDGTFCEFTDDIVACGVHGFCMEPGNKMDEFADKYGKTHVFIGDYDTRILLSGPKSKIRDEAERCMKIGKKYPGYFFNTGNHIPSNTPVEHALYYNQVYEELSKR
jgi:hypothetical protein